MNHRPSPFDRPTSPRWARHLLTLALITVPLTAQQREQSLPLVPIHTAAPDLVVEYGAWGAGSDYEMSFDDGATFVPLLGVTVVK